MASTGHEADVARQREEVLSVGQQFLSQLVPGSEEYNQLQSAIQQYAQQVASPANEQGLVSQLGQQLVSQQGSRIAAGGAASPFEARTNKAFQGLRDVSARTPEEEAVLAALRGTQTGTPLDSIFGDIVSRAQTPEDFYQSTLDQQLQLAFDQINRQAAQRGLVDSGLPIELSQRGAAELAINEAAGRQQARQTALSNFQDLYNTGAGLRSREIGLEGANVDLQQGRETDLTSIINQNTQLRGTQQGDLLQRQTATAEAEAERKRQEEAAKKQQYIDIAKQIAYMGADFVAPGLGTGLRTADSMLAQKRSQPASSAPANTLSRVAQGSSTNATSLDALLRTFGAA